MPETAEEAHRTLYRSNFSNNSSVGCVEAPYTLPVELWNAICHFLRLAAEAEVLESAHFETWTYRALHSLGQTSRFFHQLALSVRTGVIHIFAGRGPSIVKGQSKSDGNVISVFLVGSRAPVAEIIKNVTEPRQLIFTEHCFNEQHVLGWATAIPTVTSLTLRGCIDKGDFPIAPCRTTAELYSLVDLRRSNVKTLNLDYPYAECVMQPLPQLWRSWP